MRQYISTLGQGSFKLKRQGASANGPLQGTVLNLKKKKNCCCKCIRLYTHTHQVTYTRSSSPQVHPHCSDYSMPMQCWFEIKGPVQSFKHRLTRSFKKLCLFRDLTVSLESVPRRSAFGESTLYFFALETQVKVSHQHIDLIRVHFYLHLHLFTPFIPWCLELVMSVGSTHWLLHVPSAWLLASQITASQWT